MSSRRSLTEAAGSVSAGLAGQACLLVSGILAARVLGPLERGYFALLTLLPVVICEIGGLGMPAAVAYYVASRGDRQSILRTAAPVFAAQIVLLLAFQLVVGTFLFRGNAVLASTSAPMLLAVPILLTLQYSLAIHQGELRFGSYNLIRVLPVLLNSSLLVTLWLIGFRTLHVVVAAWLVGYAIAAGIAVGTVVLSVACATDGPTNVRRFDLMKYGASGLLGANSLVQTLRMDQAYIGFALAPIDLGYYVVAVSITNLPLLVGVSLGGVILPRIARLGRENQRAAVLRSLAVAALWAAPPTVLLMLLAPQLLSFFFGSRFLVCAPIARVLLIAAFFQACRRVLADALRGAGAPRFTSIAELVGWTALGLVLIVLGKRYGLAGVCWALVVGAGVSLTTLVALAVKNSPYAAPAQAAPLQVALDRL
jgi:O-antigen/teichoic acid export membrane protein